MLNFGVDDKDFDIMWFAMTKSWTLLMNYFPKSTKFFFYFFSPEYNNHIQTI